MKAQGQDWDGHFSGPLGGTHNVNLAQGLKSAAINYLGFSDGSPANGSYYRNLSQMRMVNLDENFGQPNGMYVGDEHLPPTPTRNPGAEKLIKKTSKTASVMLFYRNRWCNLPIGCM